MLFTQGLEGRVEIEAVVLGHGGKQVKIVDVAPVPALNGPFAEGQAAIGDHAPGINELPNPETI